MPNKHVIWHEQIPCSYIMNKSIRQFNLPVRTSVNPPKSSIFSAYKVEKVFGDWSCNDESLNNPPPHKKKNVIDV